MTEKRIFHRGNRQQIYDWLRGYTILIVILVLIVFGFVYVRLFLRDQIRWDYVFGASVVVLMLGLAIFDSLLEMLRKKRFWCKLAERTHLSCQIGNFFLGFPVHVEGIYRGRALSLYSHKRGKGQIPSTRIDLQVENPANASLRLRGPFGREYAASNKVVGDMFGAAEARKFGDDQQFFIRSEPLHLVTSIFHAEPLQAKLFKIQGLANVELENQRISLEQIGVLEDVEYLHFLFDLLIDLADAVDHGGYVKPVSRSSTAQ